MKPLSYGGRDCGFDTDSKGKSSSVKTNVDQNFKRKETNRTVRKTWISCLDRDIGEK